MGKKINVLTEYWNRPTDRHTHTQSTLTDSCACAYNETQTYTLWCMFWARRNTRNVCTKRNSIRKWYPDIHTTYLCMQTRTCITRPLMTLETHAFQLSETFLLFGTSSDKISRQSCKNNIYVSLEVYQTDVRKYRNRSTMGSWIHHGVLMMVN